MSFFKKLNPINPNNWLSKAIGLTDAGLGNVLGGTFNDLTGTTESARKQYEYNQALQHDAQNFAKWQMGNAHQQEVADLQSAGLNPVLSAGGSGASAGGVASNSTGPGASTGINPISAILGMVDTMNNSAKTEADITNKTNLTNAEIDKIKTETANMATKTTQMVNDEKFAKTWWGRNISPALRDIFGGGGGAVAAGATAGVASSKITSAKKAANRPIVNIHKH